MDIIIVWIANCCAIVRVGAGSGYGVVPFYKAAKLSAFENPLPICGQQQKVRQLMGK